MRHQRSSPPSPSSTASPAVAALTVLSLLCCFSNSFAGILSQPVDDGHPSPLTVPSLPLQTDSQLCHLDLSNELFGGVSEACGRGRGRDLDRSRCCPVLAAWLYAAHAGSALRIGNSTSSSSSAVSPESSDLPMLPDADSQQCVESLRNSLLSRKVRLPQPNATCDAVNCFCEIRLHQISFSSCSAAFDVSAHPNATAKPTAAVKNLERSCRDSSYSGCSKCLDALQKVKGGNHNRTDRASQMLNRDCQLMGLTWLLARNKTAYIPTVSAVLRAMMYSPHPHEAHCSPDQENMPLAVDSLSYENAESSAPSIQLHRHTVWLLSFSLPILPLIMLNAYFLPI
uniref:SPARK domain-containing protein n=1 Tax=Kalanchoe fedtschenkoi TaxID=63787 RepID=A0A7N0RJ62_KALFE